VRDILVWNTNGTMINAAVMGLMGWLRYVLITDALLEMLPEPQVRAVMAHEIGHVRRHHMLWLIGCLLASFILAAELIRWPLFGLDSLGLIRSQWVFDAIGVASGAAQLIVGLLVFGWICRRFERQADTFAVQHLSGMSDLPVAATAAAPVSETPLVSVDAVSAMRGALDSIARLNTIDPQRRSWRHGSIAWRMDYLMTIIGRPVSRLRIDGVVRWIKVAVALVLLATAGAATFDQLRAARNDSESDLEAGVQSDAARPREHLDAVSAAGTQQIGAMP
jgi:Zn-dependent protease with chaperone function